MTEQRGNAEKEPPCRGFEREIKQRKPGSSVEGGKKGEDGASSPRTVVSFEYTRNTHGQWEKEETKEEGKERRRKRVRGGKRGDRLHIKWTGNEPGYVESVGKSVCRCLSAKFARLFTWRTFRLHRVHARSSRADAVYPTDTRARVHRVYIYIYTDGREWVEGRSLVKSAQGARNGRRFSTFAIT